MEIRGCWCERREGGGFSSPLMVAGAEAMIAGAEARCCTAGLCADVSASGCWNVGSRSSA